MKHVEREIVRCESELHKTEGSDYSYLWCIQQALKWALDPLSYAHPVDTVLSGKVTVMDTQGDSKDCSADLHQPQS